MTKGRKPGGGRHLFLLAIVSVFALSGTVAAAFAQDFSGYGQSNTVLQQYLHSNSGNAPEVIQPQQVLVPPLNQVRPGQAGYEAQYGSGAATPGAQASPTERRGAYVFPGPQPLSPLERAYMDRLRTEAPRFVRTPLRQFGYNQIANLASGNEQLLAGAVSENYRLGIGDELVITFRGQVNRSYRTLVDREGRVVLPNMSPIPAAGRTFAAFRASLERRTAATFLKTEAFVSLGKVRSLPITVLGQVRNPGVQRLTGLANVFDALAAAGGVEKTGSLRRIEIIRDGRIIPVDLYQLLLTGGLASSYTLQDGDRVFVPPIGPTFAVVGDVQRPGIYELSPHRARLSIAQALALAGGALKPSGYLYLTLSPRPGGNDVVRQVVDPRTAALESGGILAVAPKAYSWTDAFFLDGDVTAPGPRSLATDPTIAAVLANPNVLGSNPYLPFGVVLTADPTTLAREFVPVDLEKIRTGKTNYRLSARDRLIVLSLSDIEYLASPPVQDILSGQGVPEGPDCRGLQRLAAVVARSRSHRFAAAMIPVNPAMSKLIPAPTSPERQILLPPKILQLQQLQQMPQPSASALTSANQQQRGASASQSPAPPERRRVTCPTVFNTYPGLLPFVLQSVVTLQGEVQRPGIYPIVPDTSLASLVRVGGGLTGDADPRQIHLTRFGSGARAAATDAERTINADKVSLLNVLLMPGDAVQFDQLYTNNGNGAVYLAGQFRTPGIYPITRGERLSQVIAQAGGLTPEAYAIGAVFTRQSVAAQQKKAYLEEARTLQSSLATTLASGQTAAATLTPAVEKVIQELRSIKPPGRVVVQADPTVLAVHPELDLLLESGDHIYMPKRPNYVTVSGEVLNPSTVPYLPDATVDEYIKAAGGTTPAAEESLTFVIFPNGDARPADISFWDFTPMHIPPGSTVVVPRNPQPFDLLKFSGSITSVLSNIALTAASLAVVARSP